MRVKNCWRIRGCAALAMAWVLLSAAAPRAVAAPPGSGWFLIQADEFSGAAVDPVKWATQYQWGRTHNHDAYMLDSAVTQSGGLLHLRATREDTSGKPYSSGVISSHDTFRYTYGYAEMRLRLTNRRGSWPAFWMLDSGWPPEIDVMEYPLFVSEGAGVNEDRYYANSHWNNGSGNQSNGEWLDRNVDLGSAFHTFGLEWTATNLRYYFDGVLVKNATVQTTSFQNMYTIFNLAVGGWPGGPSTAQFPEGATDVASADWFRVWQKPSTSVPADTAWIYNGASTGSWSTDGNWSNGQPRYEQQRVSFNTLAGRPSMIVTWNDSKTVGEVHLDGATAYALGQAGGAVENLMFADAPSGWGLLSVDGGTATHLVHARLDAWSNLHVNNVGAGTLRLTNNIVGQARPDSSSPTGVTGGIVRFTGGGLTQFTGLGSYQRDTRLESGANVIVSQRLYQENTVYADAAVRISGGSKLQIVNLNDAGTTGASLGYLSNGADRIVVDGGTLSLIGVTNSTRGLTIGAGGATIEAQATTNVTLADVAGSELVSTAGGHLTLAGEGVGVFNKALGGGGKVIKQGAGAWELRSINSYTGGTEVDEGELIVTGRTGVGLTTVAAGARLSGHGILNVVDMGGSLAPGTSVGTMRATSVVLGGESTLEIELFDLASADLLEVATTLTIGEGAALAATWAEGSTYVPALGDSFTIATAAGGIVGNGFDELSLPPLPGFDWNVDYTSNAISLEVVAATGNPADFNGDGAVDGADFLAWQRGLGRTEGATPADGDANGDGAVDAADMIVWQEQYGQGPPEELAAAIPEPGAASMASIFAAIAVVCRRRAA